MLQPLAPAALPRRYSRPKPLDHKLLRRAGLCVLAASSIFGAFFFYVVVLSRPSVAPWLSTPLVDRLRDDNYYVLLVPVLIPTATAFAWVNWMGMQSFRRN